MGTPQFNHVRKVMWLIGELGLPEREAYRIHIMIPFGELRRTGCTMEATYFAAAFRSLSRDLL